MQIFLNMGIIYQPRNTFSNEIGCLVGVVAMEWKHGSKLFFQGVMIKLLQYVSFVCNFVKLCDGAFPHDSDAYRLLLATIHLDTSTMYYQSTTIIFTIMST
jgi:hypothetical protein